MRWILWPGLGLVVGLGWGWWAQSPLAGLFVGALLGAGLGLSLAIPRERRGVLALPSWQAVVGAVCLGLGSGGMVFPATFFDPTWVLWNLPEVGESDGVILHTDAPDPARDATLVGFLQALRGVLGERVYNPGPTSCRVRIYLIRDRALYDKVRHFGGGEFGFHRPNTLRGPAVVVPSDAGVGSLTHHLAYHHLACSGPYPRFAVTGAATFLEKLVAVRHSNVWHVGLGYRHTWRETAIQDGLGGADLTSLLRDGTDQNLLRAFFVFLHHHGWLRPLMRAMEARAPLDGSLFLAVTGKDTAALEAQFKHWYRTEGSQVPQVEASFVLAGATGALAWNQDRGMWLLPNPSMAIPMLPGAL
jgi:hypothetical protein